MSICRRRFRCVAPRRQYIATERLSELSLMARAERVLTSHYIVYIHTSVQLGELWTVLNASLIQQQQPALLALTRIIQPQKIALPGVQN